jgi:hypothetical protein
MRWLQSEIEMPRHFRQFERHGFRFFGRDKQVRQRGEILMRHLFEDLSQWPNKSLEPTRVSRLGLPGSHRLFDISSPRGSALIR